MGPTQPTSTNHDRPLLASLLVLLMIGSALAGLGALLNVPAESNENLETRHSIDFAGARSVSGWSGYGSSANPAVGFDVAAETSSGDVYGVGLFSGASTITFGSDSVTSATKIQAWFAKADSSGNWEWVETATVSGGEFDEMTVSGVQVAANGDMYSTGMFYGTLTFGSHSVTSTGYYDTWIAKADTNGNWQWAKALHGNGDYDGSTVTTLDVVWATGLDAISSGGVIIGGMFIGNTEVGTATDTGGTSGDDAEVFIAKFDQSGNQQWVADARGAGYQEVQDVHITSNGDAWISTTYDTGMTFGSHSLNGNSGTTDAALAKISSSGNWASATGIAGSGDKYIRGIDSYSNGDLILAGTLTSDATFGSTSLISQGGETDGWVASLTTPSTWNWANSIGGTSYDRATDVAVDVSSSNAVVAISSASVLTLGSTTLTPQGANDSAIGVVDSTGNWQSAYGAGSTSDDSANAIAIDQSGAVTVVGSFGGTMDFSSTNSNSQTTSSNLAPYFWGATGLLADDADGDGVPDDTDNCPVDDNPGQEDHDGDLEGDACDYDDDNDTILDNSGDDCPLGELGWISDSDALDKNTSTDWDLDGCKDLSEDLDDDNDNVTDLMDNCPKSDWDHDVLQRPIWVSDASSDMDGDGCRDADEDMDDDGDGYPDIVDGCPSVAGTSTLGLLGCPDDDGDGWDNMTDDCPLVAGTSSNGTLNGCLDGDGDGWADSEDAVPFDPTQWIDSDGDGFGDNAEGNNPDDCPNYFGDSLEDRIGCPDSDADGWSDPDGLWTIDDGADALPQDSTQWTDYDEDGYGDNYGNESWTSSRIGLPGEYVFLAAMQDACPTQEGTSWKDDFYGCPDSDDDGYADLIDAFPTDENEYQDSDGDGIGDGSDACVNQAGNSTADRIGCLDSDGDGYSDPDGLTWFTTNGADAFRMDASQWADTDADSFGDNPNGTDPDACPFDFGTSVKEGWLGCPPEMIPEDPKEEDEGGLFGSGSGIGGDGNTMYIIIGVVAVVLIIVAILLVSATRRNPEDEDKWESEEGMTGAYAQPAQQGQVDAYGRPVVQQAQPVLMPQSGPGAEIVGQVRSDNNEWLEHPDGSGAWYMRDPVTRHWVRRI